ncbi:MAG: DUF1540 domain-containing protein [Betaproteobacteria bacterium]
MAKKMPFIIGCDAENCAYNRDKECHALAITVGVSGLPRCDTYTSLSGKGGVAESFGSVGACREELCTFNDSLECTSAAVLIRMRNGRPICIAFQSKMVHYRAA